MSKRVAELQGAELDYGVFRSGDPMCAGLKAKTVGEGWLLVAEDGGSVCTFITEGNAFERIRLMRAHCIPGGTTDYKPSRDWSQGGPIIEREKINMACLSYPDRTEWRATCHPMLPDFDGPTPLVAAMRAFVASRFSDVVYEVGDGTP